MYYSHPASVKTNARENRRSIDLVPTSRPAPWKDIVSRELSRLLRAFPRTRALILIGSVADGTWEPDSDIDVVWMDPDTVTAAEVALQVHHEHRCSTLAETRRILCLWRQLRPRLTAAMKAQASEHKEQP